MDTIRIVEAVLFSSSRPIKISEIEGRTSLGVTAIRKALKQLEKEYTENATALTVAKTGDGYTFLLKEEYAQFGRQFSPKEVPDDVLRTAAMIAYHQPVLQSELSRSLGPRVYGDVKVLQQLGIVSGKKKGQTILLTTTKKFAEYFGIEGAKRADIKKWMEEQSAAPNNE